MQFISVYRWFGWIKCVICWRWLQLKQPFCTINFRNQVRTEFLMLNHLTYQPIHRNFIPELSFTANTRKFEPITSNLRVNSFLILMYTQIAHRFIILFCFWFDSFHLFLKNGKKSMRFGNKAALLAISLIKSWESKTQRFVTRIEIECITFCIGISLKRIGEKLSEITTGLKTNRF